MLCRILAMTRHHEEIHARRGRQGYFLATIVTLYVNITRL
ncbi:hypothetical protein SXCC_01587 [Gluconacetobacter sp. SXCC-1]|nr:hypothetical protein SXCC_01587 [Gluconacetobacter sp. SXCC-1]